MALFGQQDKVVLDWDKPQKWETIHTKNTFPSTKSNATWFDATLKKLVFEYQTHQYLSAETLQITEVIASDVNEEELYDLNVHELDTVFSVEVAKTYQRGKLGWVVNAQPFYVENGRPKRVESFVIRPQFINLNSSLNTTKKISSNSVLSTGSWFRFSVEKSGVYKLSYDFLSRLGLSLNTTNPNHLQVYGNGGRMIPILNKDVETYTNEEIPIQVIGAEDGRFDSSDYILFYAEGPDQWNEESQTHRNLFTQQTTYFIGVRNQPAKRIQFPQTPAATPSKIFQVAQVELFHELELENMAKQGRRWFGETFIYEPEQTFEFTLSDRFSGSGVRVDVKAAALSSVSSSLKVDVAGSQMNFSFPEKADSVEGTEDSANPIGKTLTKGQRFLNINPGANDLQLKMSYENNGNPLGSAFLDFIKVHYQRELKGSDQQYICQIDHASEPLSSLEFNNTESIMGVWDITNRFDVLAYEIDSENTQLTTSQKGLRKYLVFPKNDFFEPKFHPQGSRVQNQDIHSKLSPKGGASTVDYLIITNTTLKSEAQRLAEFHKNFSGLNAVVLSLDEIYNDFNTGNPDIGAIRNAIKFAYDQATNPNNKIKYVCLFGDTTFDYQNRISINNNIVPTFYSYESFSLTSSFMSDDYYAMMDPLEGSLAFSDKMDLAVGRILADDVASARSAVDKIIRYHDKKNYGAWRNTFLLISDDVDRDWETTIQENLDKLGDQLAYQKPFVNVKKIHLDSYQQEVGAGGDRYPAVNAAIKSQLNLGTLTLSYFGHGSEDGLASERIFDKADATSLYNPNRLPLVVTATCEFSRFDNPFRITAGELTFANPNGGAIGLVSTTRQIFVNNGITYNNQFTKELYAYGSEDYPSVGEALRRAKANFSGTAQRRIVFYIGDPALKLAIPKPKVVLTHFNDKPIDQALDTLKALSKVKFKGAVLDATNQPLTDYNGEASLIVFDKEAERTTLANDGIKPVMKFKQLGETVFNGKATIENGLFELSFIVPKDIQLPVGKARISLYAQQKDQFIDQAGVYTEIPIGGLDNAATNDTQGPSISLYMNDLSFVNGGITNESPILLAVLSDESGINTAGGIGHDIMAVIDHDTANPFVLNQYYQTDKDTYQSGQLQYALRNLEPGLHTISLTAWDVYNNSSTQDIQFLVLDNNDLVLDRVLNYPNPFVSHTEFWFQHNKPFEPLEVTVQVFTISGKQLWSTRQTITTDGFLSREIAWDGRDAYGQAVGKGVYVYTISVKSTLSNMSAKKTEKLVILR